MARNKGGGGGGHGGGGGSPEKKPTAADLQTFAGLPLVGQVFAWFKDFMHVDLSTVLSWFDKEAEDFAAELAKAANKKVGKNSLVRSWIVQRFSSVVINQIEKLGDKQPPMIQSLVEKLTDFLEHFRNCFMATGPVEDAPAFPIDPKLLESFAKVDEAILNLTAKDMANEPDPIKRAAIGKQAVADYAFLAELKKIMVHGPSKPTEPAEPTIPFEERLERIDASLTTHLQPVKAALEKAINELEASNRARKAHPKPALALSPVDRWANKMFKLIGF